MGQKWDSGTIEQARVLRSQGRTFREVEAETGIPKSTLSRLLSQACQPATFGSDLAQPGVDGRIKALELLVERLQEQLQPILKERARAIERIEEASSSGLKFRKR